MYIWSDINPRESVRASANGTPDNSDMRDV